MGFWWWYLPTKWWDLEISRGSFHRNLNKKIVEKMWKNNSLPYISSDIYVFKPRNNFIVWRDEHVGVSENRGTPKSSILIGFSSINHPFGGTPIFWKHPCANGRISFFTFRISPVHFTGDRSVEFKVGREGVGGILPRSDSASLSHT